MKTYRKSIDLGDVCWYLLMGVLIMILTGLLVFIVCGVTDTIWVRTEYSDTMTGIVIEKDSYTEVSNHGNNTTVVYELYTMNDESVDCINVTNKEYVMHKVGETISYRKKEQTGNVFGWYKVSRLELVE